MRMSNHAVIRSSQRGINCHVVDALLAYGVQKRHRGADIYYFDRQRRTRAAKAMCIERFRQYEKSLNSYVVVSDDGCIITTARRLTRLKFN